MQSLQIPGRAINYIYMLQITLLMKCKLETGSHLQVFSTLKHICNGARGHICLVVGII